MGDEPARVPSPADLRLGLDPDAVDGLADGLHSLRCVTLSGVDLHRGDGAHREAELSHARFTLAAMRDAGWSLTAQR